MSDFNDFQVLRYKGPETTVTNGDDIGLDDPDWHAEQVNPNSGRYEVAGTASAGDYIITCTPVDGAPAASVTFDRDASQTNAQIATGLASEANTAVAADLQGKDGPGIAGFIRSATSPSTGVVRIVYRQRPVDFVVSLTAPGSGTLTHYVAADSQSDGNRFPTARAIPFDRRRQLGPNTNVEITVVGITTAGAVVAPGNCTYSMEMLEVIPRKADNGTELDDAIASRGEDAGTPLGSVHTFQCNGAHAIGVRMHTIANEDASVDRFEIRYRAVVV